MRKLILCGCTLALFAVGTACDSGDSSNETKKPKNEESSEETSDENDSQRAAEDGERSGDLVSTQLARVGESIGCPSEEALHRVWCIATEGWSKGEPAELPDGEAALLGVTLEVEKGVTVAKSLKNRVDLSGLAIRNSGGSATANITSVEPENEKENEMFAKSILALSKLFKGGDPPATIPKKLMGFLQSLPKQAEYEVEKGDKSWRWKGASEAQLRKVDDYWIAIEIPEERNGIFVNIFTDEIEAEAEE